MGNTPPTYPLGDAEIEVPLVRNQDDLGEVKSTVDYRYGESVAKGYTVTFRRVAEAHGSLVSGASDNGSLLALMIQPRTDSPKRRFRSFSVELSLELATEGYSNKEPPSLVAFEPAADGDQYFQEKVIDVTKTTGLEAGLSIPGLSVVTGDLKGTMTTEKKFERRQRLKLSTRSWGTYSGKDTKVKFHLESSSKEDGIGDRFVVALIIKRSPGTGFFIRVSTTADMNFLPKDALPWKSQKGQNSLRLGPIGPESNGGQTELEGLDAANLNEASNHFLKKLAYIHVPEKGTDKLFLSAEALGASEMVDHDHDSKISASTSIADPTFDNSNPQETSNSPTRTATSPDINVPTEIGVLSSPVAGVEAGRASLEGPSDGGREIRQRGRSLFAIQNSRAARHRLMASLHQHLAQLHLDEADEVESLLELVHADQDMARTARI